MSGSGVSGHEGLIAKHSKRHFFFRRRRAHLTERVELWRQHVGDAVFVSSGREGYFRGYFASFKSEYERQSLGVGGIEDNLFGHRQFCSFLASRVGAFDEPFGALFGNEKPLSMFLAVRFHTRYDYIRQADGPVGFPLAK